MSLTTYAGLQTTIADFLDRQDLTATIPTFIALAEARISRDLSHWKQEKRVDTTFNERYELVPNDMIEALCRNGAARLTTKQASPQAYALPLDSLSYTQRQMKPTACHFCIVAVFLRLLTTIRPHGCC